jgi:hypothetical protein
MLGEDGEILSYNNIAEEKVEERAAAMRESGTMIEVPLGDDESCYIYYDDSDTLVQLAYYPYIQLAVVMVFFIICFI